MNIIVFTTIAVSLVVVATSISMISQATPTDQRGRGRWGVLQLDSRRHRRLDMHERRWETLLTTSKKQRTRWPLVLEELARLERTEEVAHDPSPPPSYDANWLESRLALIEAQQESRLEHDV
ncbi:MAG: hypothetical protein AAF567_03145 [Actinomycetota bacterium]